MPKRLWGVLLGVFVLAATAALPLRLAVAAARLDERGLSAREARGTIWAGQLVEAQFAGIPLGTIDVHVSPWRLFLGRLHLTLEDQQNPHALAGILTTSRHRFAVEDLNARVPIETIIAGVPLDGTVNIVDAGAVFDEGICTRASGNIVVDAQPASGAGALSFPSLDGTLRCESGDAATTLSGDGGAVPVQLRIAMNAAGEMHAGLLTDR